MSAIEWMSVSELSAGLASGELSSREIVERCLERIATHDGRLHAFIDVYDQDAREAADAADRARKSGHGLGPLHGVPVAVKDIVDIEGRITTGGSKVWEDRVSTTTATLVENMIAAGMIVLGKTHTVEFAMGSFGTNQYLGTPVNPWDLELHRAPGGSSAGTGVAVAAGLAPWGIGTDTGGSVRIPSAWCGLSGLKTTIGRVSTHGVLPLSHTLDTPGPMCRTIEDAALLYRVLATRDARDPKTLIGPKAHCGTGRRDVEGLVLGRLPELERDGVDPEVLAHYDASLEVLAGAGAHIVDVTLPWTFDDLGSRVGRIIGAEGYAYVGELVDDPALAVDEAVRPRIGIGRDMSARDYLHALRDQQATKVATESALEGVDAFLTPTTATAAPVVDEIDQTGTAAGFTRPFNLIEWCAAAVPNGFTASGLPTSLQIACRGRHERTAIRIASAYQRATDWHRRHPALAG